MGFAGSWNELWISKFSPRRFESIAPVLPNVGVKGRQFGGTAYDKAPALGLRRHGISFPPVLSPRCVTIVTKFFCTDTEPQHGPHMFGSGWRRVLTWDRSPGCLPDARITATRMIIERIADSASPSIKMSSASFPRRANVTGLGPAEK